MSTVKYYVWLQSRVGAAAAGNLLRRFGTAEGVFFAGKNEYESVEDLREKDIAALGVKELTEASDILARCAQLGVRILTIQDAEYPERLRNIYDPPVVLYVKGRLPALDEEAAIGIVGTRESTPYGMKTAETCGYELARHGLVIVTGLARGGDTAAALGALRGGGVVIGVLGCGIDVVYPRGNKALFEDVTATGALISEYPPGTEVSGKNFPVRNRIISGVSVGVIVTEAPQKSGALITASRALEQGRDVFAVPGNVDAKMSEGTNSLLREGATPMTSPMDIVAEYAELFPLKIKTGKIQKVPLDKKRERSIAHGRAQTEKMVDNIEPTVYIDVETVALSLSGAEKSVFDALRALGGRAHIDDIIAKSGIAASDALGALTMLEIGGNMSSAPGGMFILPGAE